MARRGKEGEVVVREWKKGRQFVLRFRAYGERRYLPLGYEGEGDPPWSFESADEELQNILADVRRGLWVPPPSRKPKSRQATGEKAGPVVFGPFANEIVKDRKGRVSENQHEYREWALKHLIPYFGQDLLLEIDAERIDGYVTFKVKEAEILGAAIERGRAKRDSRGMVRRPLSPVSINKTVDMLQWLLGIAVEYRKRTGLIENAAVGGARRVKEPERRPVHLDTAEQIEGLLEACAELDRAGLRRSSRPRALQPALARRRPRQRADLHRSLEDAGGAARDPAVPGPP
jgi:hypothetical protein